MTQKLLFHGKSALFTDPLFQQQEVLSWKMIARYHSRVQLTAGKPREKTESNMSAFFVNAADSPSGG